MTGTMEYEVMLSDHSTIFVRMTGLSWLGVALMFGHLPMLGFAMHEGRWL